MQKKIPNLFILGAQKSGTTSLSKYMSKHKDIFVSNPIKEPGYYWGDENFMKYWKSKDVHISSRDQLLHDYMLIGYNNEKYICDASTFYTIANYSRTFGIPERMKNEIEDPKFIYIMRNPIEKIISGYLHLKRFNKIECNFGAFVENDYRYKQQIKTSLYHWQISYYHNFFNRDRFHYIIFERLVLNPNEIMNMLYDFLAIDRIEEEQDYKVYNKAKVRDQIPKEDLKFTSDQFKALLLELNEDRMKLQELLVDEIPEWDFSKYEKYVH